MHVARDFEVPAIVPHLAGQRKRALVLLSIGFHREVCQPLSQQAPAGHPVGHLADAGFERPVDVVNDVSVQSDTSHQQKVTGNAAAITGKEADGKPLGAPFRELRGGAVQPSPESHFHRQHVRCPGRQNRQGHVSMHHAFYHFVNGAIAAGGNDQVGAAGNVFARNRTRGSRAGSGSHGDRMSVLAEDLYGPFQKRTAAALEFARPRIVYEDSIPVVGDGFSAPSFA